VIDLPPSSTGRETEEPSPVYTSMVSPTKTIIPAPNPTSTSILPQLQETLTPISVNERITYLFIKPVCNLPCWWNIIPGSTSWEDTDDLFAFLELSSGDRGIGKYSMHEVIIGNPESLYKIRIQTYEKNNIVDYIAVRSVLTQSDLQKMYSIYEPKVVLQNYGIPSRIFVFASLLGDTNYELDLFYDKQGFMISYGGKIKEANQSGVVICPDFSKGNIGGIGIYIQATSLKDTIDNFPDEELQVSLKIRKPLLRTIESASGMSNKEFMDHFVGENPIYCFTISE